MEFRRKKYMHNVDNERDLSVQIKCRFLLFEREKITQHKKLFLQNYTSE